MTVVPAICWIRFEKLTAVKKMFVFSVKNTPMARIPTMTGRKPTSPPLNASQRARTIEPRLSCSAAGAWTSAGGAAELMPAPAPPSRR